MGLYLNIKKNLFIFGYYSKTLSIKKNSPCFKKRQLKAFFQTDNSCFWIEFFSFEMLKKFNNQKNEDELLYCKTITLLFFLL